MNTIIQPSQATALVLAGLDPTGGAGLAADIGAISSMGVHAMPIATCLTVQDTLNVSDVYAVDKTIIEQQLNTLAADLPINAIKIGLLHDADSIAIIESFLKAHPDIPVVLDPVLRAGGGKSLSSDKHLVAIQSLLPHTDVITPNLNEACLLAGMPDGSQAETDSAMTTAQTCAKKLLAMGCHHILITGTDSSAENAAHVSHFYFNPDNETERYEWPKLLGHFHGSGCTLSAAIAGLLAQGLNAKDAIAEAQQYTWDTLANALHLSRGQGQAIANRFYWSHDS